MGTSKFPTIHDVAAKAGVSVATASRALGNYGRIADSTRANVVAIANQLGYRPNGLARSMITGRTQTLGVICADIHSPFFAGVVRGITDTAKQAGYSVLITNSDEQYESEKESLDLLLEKQVDGIIVSPADVRQVEHLAAAASRGTPIVMVDRASTAFPTDSVMIDGPAATQDAVSSLFELGHRRVAIVAELRSPQEADWRSIFDGNGYRTVDTNTLNPSSARLTGYLRAHAEYGIEVDPALVFKSGEYSAESATRATLTGLSRRNRPTAVVAIDNTMTLGAYRAIRELGLVIPRDVSFIGFDNLEWTELVDPGISVIDQPVYEIGQTAVKLLLGKLTGGGGVPEVVTMPSRFIRRGSVAGPRS